MMHVSLFYLLKERGDIGIITETDKGLCFMASYDNVIALVLTAKLIIVFYIEFTT